MLVGFPPYYTENIKKLYEDIKSAKLKIPAYVSPQAKDLLNKLLNKNPKQRIGVKDKSEIKRHPFFKGIDWEKLLDREIKPPIHLKLEDTDQDEETAYLVSIRFTFRKQWRGCGSRIRTTMIRTKHTTEFETSRSPRIRLKEETKPYRESI